MDFVKLPLLAAAALVFFSVLTGLFSARIGSPFLLVSCSPASWPARTVSARIDSTTSG